MRSLVSTASVAVLALLAHSPAAQGLPRISLGCGLPRTTDLSEFCIGTGNNSTNLECRSQGAWDHGQTFSAYCAAAVNPQFTFDGETRTAVGPYVVLTLQTSVPLRQAPWRSSALNSARAGAGFTIRANAPPGISSVPLRMRVVGSLRADSANGHAVMAATVRRGPGTIAAFIAVADSAGGVMTDRKDFDQVVTFNVLPNSEQGVGVELEAIITGPVTGMDPNGGGRLSGFIDPLPELDTSVDPAKYGLPANWLELVTLEISEDAIAKRAPDGGVGGASDGAAAGGGGSGGGGCSVSGRRAGGGAMCGLLLALGALFLARRGSTPPPPSPAGRNGSRSISRRRTVVSSHPDRRYLMNRFTTCFALVFASTLGCGVEPDGNLADVASQEQALFGVPDPGPAQPVSAPHRPGVVQITIPGDPVVRTGLLVSPDLVMVSRRWFSSNTVAADLRIRHGISSILLPAPERPGWTLTINDSMPMAFIQVFNPFPNVPPVTFSSRGPAQLLGTSASCFGFDSGTVFWQREQNIVAVGGGREVLGSTPINLLQDRHAGAPCFDSGGAVIGFLLSTEGSLASYRSRIHATFDARSFIDNMLRVARLRRLPGAPTLGFKIETSVGFTPMCIEVPHGDPFALSIPANVVPCQAGRNNQRWFLDYSNLNGPAFVSALTGTCIDVPGGSTMPNALLGMSSCNGGTNQAWTGTFRSTLSPASSPLDFRYAPARRSLCLVPAERFFAIPSRLTQDVCSFQPYAREEWAFNW